MPLEELNPADAVPPSKREPHHPKLTNTLAIIGLLAAIVFGTLSAAFCGRENGPLFGRNGAGLLLPISLTGTRENPQVGLDLGHRK